MKFELVSEILDYRIRAWSSNFTIACAWTKGSDFKICGSKIIIRVLTLRFADLEQL